MDGTVFNLISHVKYCVQRSDFHGAKFFLDIVIRIARHSYYYNGARYEQNMIHLPTPNRVNMDYSIYEKTTRLRYFHSLNGPERVTIWGIEEETYIQKLLSTVERNKLLHKHTECCAMRTLPL